MLGYHYCSEKEGPPGKEVHDVSLRGNNPPTVGRRYTDVESKKDPLGRKFMMYPSKGKINPLWAPPFLGMVYGNLLALFVCTKGQCGS